MDRLRRAYNWSYIKLRPLRRKLRDPKLRSVVLKWCFVGMLVYLFLYTTFYIMIRNNYLFGLDEGSSELLEQYSLDLKACWHSKEHEIEATNLPMKVSFHSVEALQSLKHTRHAQKNAQRTDNTRKVLVLGDHSHKQNGEHIDILLDAGMCIATHNGNVNKNKQSYLRSFSTPDSSTTDTTATIHTVHNTNTTTTATTSTSTNTATIDTTHYTTRCLPSFIIAGAMKCGTGELMKWLQLHPSLTVGSNEDKRELHYFTSISGNGNGSGGSGLSGSVDSNSSFVKDTHHNHRRLQTASTNTSHIHTTHPTHTTHMNKPSRLAEYAHFFPAFDHSELEGLITFEKSPDYIRDPAALKLIRYFMPTIKIIVLLRNPVIRALSEFSHHCRHGRYVKLSRDIVVSTGNSTGSGTSGTGESGTSGSSSGTSDSVTSGSGSGSVVYKSGTILRIDVHNHFASIPQSSYEVLTYPCSAADAEHYFTSASGTTAYTTTYTSSDSSANTLNTTLDQETISTSTDRSAASPRKHHLPEIEHGLYDHQLAALYEIFPADQVLVLLQEDMYSHTFRTLRQVESFLKIGCFDYQAYSIIPASSVMSKPLLDAQDTGDDAFTDDHYTTTGPSADTTGGAGGNGKDKSSRGVKSSKNGSKKGDKHHAKPPRRAPQTFDEKMKHYKAELEQYLSSWKGLSMSTSTNLYDSSSDTFKDYLHSVYRTSNSKLSMLLYDRYKIDAFARQHLIEVGWDLGVL